MKTISHSSKLVALLVLVFSAVGELSVSATAVSSTTATDSIQQSQPTSFVSQSNFQVAQGNLVGQCRAAKQRIFVYTERSTTSQTVRTIGPNQQVTLADNGSNGWIAISSPVTGYVRASDLKLCQGGTQPPPQTSNLCRTVTAQDGLSVRQNPSFASARVGGVFLGNTVTLANPQQSQVNPQEGNRTWIRIVAPTAGWISSGFPEGNLGPAFSCR